MPVLYLLLFLLSGVFFGLAAGRVANRFDFLSLGLLCWAVVFTIQAAQRL